MRIEHQSKNLNILSINEIKFARSMNRNILSKKLFTSKYRKHFKTA